MNKDIVNSAERPIGRPRAVIDWRMVDKYLYAGCSGVGIAGLLGISRHTLYRACLRDNKVAFDTYSQQKKTVGNDLIKVAQFRLAMQGDVSMLIWLGKQRLGQKDCPDSDINTPSINEPITGIIVR